MERLYASCKQAYDDLEGKNLFEFCTKAENQIDIAKTMETFNFIDKSISINEVITEDTAKRVVNEIRFWNSLETIDSCDPKEPIVIYIDSSGGDLNATYSIIAAIELSTVPIFTVNMGKAYSGGFFILISGTKRFAVPYCSYLFHEGSVCSGDDAHKFLQHADFYRHQLSQLKEITLNNTTISEELYNKHKKDDWWFGNQTALKYKVIDEEIVDFNDFRKELIIKIEDGEEEEDYE